MPAAVPRKRSGWRCALWAAAACVALYAAFESGRWAAGFAVVETMVERVSLEATIDRLTRNESNLRRELAVAQVRSTVDHEANREAQRMLGELQAEVGRQQQELQFYRGVLAREFGAGSLRVQELAVHPGGARDPGVAAPGPRDFVLEAMLVQAGARDAVVKGELTVTIDGTRAGALTRLTLAEVTPERRRSVPFSLRYFQALQIPVVLPAGFLPTGVTLELHSAAAGPGPERRSFPWRAGSTDTLTP